MHALCLCGNSCIPDSYYCSPQCAREDAFNSLTLGKPHESIPRWAPLPALPPGFFDLPPRRLHTHSSSLDIGDICPEDLDFAIDHGPFQPVNAHTHTHRRPRSTASPSPATKSKKKTTKNQDAKDRKQRKERKERKITHQPEDRITSVPQSLPCSITTSVSSIAPARRSDWKSHYQRAQERASLEDALDVPFFLLDTDVPKTQVQVHDNDFDNDNERVDHDEVTRPAPPQSDPAPRDNNDCGDSDDCCQLPVRRAKSQVMLSTRIGSFGPVTSSLPSIAYLEDADENITGVDGNFPTRPICPSSLSLSNSHSHEHLPATTTKRLHHSSSSSYTTNFTSGTSGTTRSSYTSSMGSSLDRSPTKSEFSKRKSRTRFGSAFGSPEIIHQKHPNATPTENSTSGNPNSTANSGSSSFLTPVIHLSIHFKEGLRRTKLQGLQGHQRRPSSDRTPRVEKTPGFEIVHPPPSSSPLPLALESIKPNKSEKSTSKVSKLSFSTNRAKSIKEQRDQRDQKEQKGKKDQKDQKQDDRDGQNATSSLPQQTQQKQTGLEKAPGPTPILKRQWNPLKLAASNPSTGSNASGSAPEPLFSQSKSKSNEPTPSDSRRAPQTQSQTQLPTQTLTPSTILAPASVSASVPTPAPAPISVPVPSTPVTAPSSIPAIPAVSSGLSVPATSNASTFPPAPAPSMPSTSLSRPGVVVKKTSLLPKGRLPIGSSITRSPQLQPTKPKGQGQGQGYGQGSAIGLSKTLPKTLPDSNAKPLLQPQSYRAPAFAMNAPKIPVSTMSLRTSPSKKSLRGNGTDGHVRIPSVSDDLDLGLDRDRENEEEFNTKDNVSDVPQAPPVPSTHESEPEPVMSHMTGSYFKLYSAPKSRKAIQARRADARGETDGENEAIGGIGSKQDLTVIQDQPVDVADTTDSEDIGDAVDTTSSVSIVDMEDIANMTGVAISIARDAPLEFPFYVQEGLLREKDIDSTRRSETDRESLKEKLALKMTPKSSGLRINLIPPESELRDLDPLELTPRGSPATSVTSANSAHSAHSLRSIRSVNSANLVEESENENENENERSPSTAGAPPTPRAQAEYQSFWFSSPDLGFQTLPPLPSLPPNYPLPAIPTHTNHSNSLLSTLPPLSALPTVSSFPPRPSTAEGMAMMATATTGASGRKWGSDAGIGRIGSAYLAYAGRDRGNSLDMPSSLSQQRRQQYA